MGNFNRDNRRGGGRSFGGGSSFRGPKQMFQATCSECGEDCEIPFEPRDGRPVFCSNCFKKQGGSSFSKPDRRDSYRPKAEPVINYKEDLARINDKLKQIIELLKGKNEVAVIKEEEPEKTKKLSAKTKKIVKKLKAKKKK